jgi:hypothetical protein
VLWTEHTSYAAVGLAYALIGVGVGFAGTPASHSLTGSVPVTKAGMASGTADLQRDLGGAIMQSILGALLAAGYASAFTDVISGLSSSQQAQISDEVESELLKSFSSAATTAESYPEYADQIVQAARDSFTQGQNWAYLAGLIAIGLGFLLVFFAFPKHDAERAMLARFRAEDEGAT